MEVGSILACANPQFFFFVVVVACGCGRIEPMTYNERRELRAETRFLFCSVRLCETYCNSGLASGLVSEEERIVSLPL